MRKKGIIRRNTTATLIYCYFLLSHIRRASGFFAGERLIDGCMYVYCTHHNHGNIDIIYNNYNKNM